MAEEKQDNKDKLMKDAQYRKGLSIAFFNATNAAIEFAKINGMAGVLDPKKFIAEWRDWFIEEHKNYYSIVIAQVGTNYSVEETTAKISKVATLDELQSVWIGLSEDERRNPEIFKLAQEKKISMEVKVEPPKVKEESKNEKAQ